MEGLGADLPQRLGRHVVQRLQDVGYQGTDVLHAIADGHNYQDRDWQRRKVLLELDILISG